MRLAGPQCLAGRTGPAVMDNGRRFREQQGVRRIGTAEYVAFRRKNRLLTGQQDRAFAQPPRRFGGL